MAISMMLLVILVFVSENFWVTGFVAAAVCALMAFDILLRLVRPSVIDIHPRNGIIRIVLAVEPLVENDAGRGRKLFFLMLSLVGCISAIYVGWSG